MTTTRSHPAIAKFERTLANPLLVNSGQYYWHRLAERALTLQGQRAAPPSRRRVRPSGSALIAELWSSYRRTGQPRTATQLSSFFRRRFARDVDAEDVERLRVACKDQCHNTVVNVVALLRRSGQYRVTGRNTLGSLGPYPPAWISPLHSARTSDPCEVRFRPDLAKYVRRLGATLASGYVVKAGVQWPVDCVAKPGHYVLVLAPWPPDRFLYWNTVGNDPARYHPSRHFGVFAFDRRTVRLEMDRGPGTHRWPVSSLQPLRAG